MHYKELVLAVVVALVSLVIQVSCTSAASLQISNPELTAREFTGASNVKSSMAALTGIATNIKDTTARNCTITVTFYDEQSTNLGVASVSRESLGPGEVWNFTVQLTSPDAWKARSYEISTSNQ